ncbi:hypothetical protein Hanom_Chr04g00337171 [Helianthus anomalus]
MVLVPDQINVSKSVFFVSSLWFFDIQKQNPLQYRRICKLSCVSYQVDLNLKSYFYLSSLSTMEQYEA